MLVARTKTKKKRKGKPSKERKKKRRKKGIIIPTVIRALHRKDVLNSPLNK